MRNLLNANFFRLKRNPVFWVCITTMLLGSAGMMVLWCVEDAQKGIIRELDVFYFRLSIIVSLTYAVFTCLFLNVEYSEGAIRNKLAVGHTRQDVYLSSFLTVFAASLSIALVWLAGSWVGMPFLGFLTLSPAGVALCLAVIVGFTAAFSAIFTFIEMLNTRRSAMVVTILVWLALLLLASMVDNTLYEPEFTTGITITSDGVQTMVQEPNPYYISGLQRDIYEFIMDFLPSGQAGRLQNIALDHPVRMLLCSAFVTTATTLGGLFLFKRKDLK